MEETPPFCVYYWPADGVPLSDQIDSIKRKIEKEGIGLIVVDSVAEACGGEPERADVALKFFRALKRLGLPSILIAHVTKSMDAKKPFGSGFWHNEARRTWYVNRVQEEETDEIDLGLYCRKVNDGRFPAPLSLHVSFEGEQGPVTISLQAMDAVPELLEGTSNKNRVWAALWQPMTIKEIATESGLATDAVWTVLRREKTIFEQFGTVKDGRAIAKTYRRSVNLGSDQRSRPTVAEP